MSGRAKAYIVAVCFSLGGDISAWQVSLASRERVQLFKTLMLMREFGMIASFTVSPHQQCDWRELIDQLGHRCGEAALAACLASPPGSAAPAPAFVMPVWPFDHEVAGSPASTAQFLGLDLEVIATPSPNEELGVRLPDRDGLWSIHARPLVP